MCGTSQLNPSKSSAQPVYQLTCSVCQGQFSEKNDWLRHLTQDDHQNLARLECLEKWDSEFRKCCLIVYTSEKLKSETAGEIVNYFSNQFVDTVVLVTDFVWWEDRPQLGILQFESREKLKDVLKEVGSKSSSKILIGSGFSVQVRAGPKLMEWEWQAILPPQKKSIENATQNASSSDHIMEPEPNDQEQSLPPPKRVKLDGSVKNAVISDDCVFSGSVIRSKKAASVVPPINILRSDQAPPSTMTSASHPLQFEYWITRKDILIPDDQYNEAMAAVSSLQTVLAKLVPNLEVHVFRHWYLKLKFPAEQPDLLLFAYTLREISTDLFAKLTKISNLGLQHHLRRISFKLVKYPKKSDAILKIYHIPTNLEVSLLTPKAPGSLMEFQVCRMMDYLCQFDPRCYPLITLACNWLTINSTDISGEASVPENPLELPPHYTIQWLVLFFMAQGNYIPSPRQVQKESLPEDLALTDDLISGTKIGFTWSPKYIQDWRNFKKGISNTSKDYCISVDENSEEFVLSLLRLFHKFIHFCVATLGDKKINYVLNVIDGIMIITKDLVDSDSTAGKQYMEVLRWPKIVSAEDIIELRNLVKKDISMKGKCEMYMTHPFLVGQKMSLADDIKVKFKNLSVTDGKMASFLNQVKKSGVHDALGKWNSLKYVLTNVK